MATVSVVIPTYNRVSLVERAIESALTQTLEDIEVIVVDDRSTDDTEAVVAAIDDKRVRFLRHDENRGGSAARNTGIDHARGEYIALLDDDDEWLPQKLERQHHELECRGADWVGAYCDFRQLRSNTIVEYVDNLIRRPTGFEGDEELIERIFLRTFAHGGTSTLFVRAEAVEAIGGFDTTFDRHQDLEFLVRLLHHGKLAYVDEMLVRKRDTGYPSASCAARSRARFNERFAEELAERGMVDRIERIQRFNMAKYHLREGRLRMGLVEASRGECPHHRDALGLVLALVSGIQTNTGRVMSTGSV